MLVFSFKPTEVNHIIMQFYILCELFGFYPSAILHGVTKRDVRVDDVKAVSGRKAVLWKSM